MSYPCSILDLEKKKFFDNGNGEPTVRVGGGGSILQGLQFDEIQGAETSPTVETYTYFLQSDLVATITVTYSDSTKCFVNSVVRT